MAVAARGYRYARTGAFADVLKLEEFTAKLSNIDKDVVVEITAAPMSRTAAAVVNGTALGQQGASDTLDTAPLNAGPFPRVGGFQGIGTVVDAGRQGSLKEGDKVWVSPSSGVGTWATHVAVNANHVHALPSTGLPDALAANATELITARQLLTGYARLAKGDIVVQNGGSSLTATAVTALGAAQGLQVLTAAAPGDRFKAAAKRQKDAGAAEVVEYTAKGARALRAAIEKAKPATGGAKLFCNGVGGPLFNEYMKLLGDESYAVTFGAQHGFGLMWTSTQHIFKDCTHTGCCTPRLLTNMTRAERQAALEKALEACAKAKLQYPTEEVALDAFPGAWDSMYLGGGVRPIVAPHAKHTPQAAQALKDAPAAKSKKGGKKK